MRRNRDWLPATGRPGLIVAGRLGATPLRQGRTARAVGARRPREVGPVRLLPGVLLCLVLRRRHVDYVMQPTMPARRHGGSLRDPVVNHPASLDGEHRIDSAALRPVIAVAEFVLADELAVEPRP